jgi:hypothetical protein
VRKLGSMPKTFDDGEPVYVPAQSVTSEPRYVQDYIRGVIADAGYSGNLFSIRVKVYMDVAEQIAVICEISTTEIERILPENARLVDWEGRPVINIAQSNVKKCCEDVQNHTIYSGFYSSKELLCKVCGKTLKKFTS